MPTLYREGYIYYGKTHRHPNSTFQYTVRSNLDLFTFDAADNMDLINQPLLMIAGDKADTLYMTEDAFKKATGTNNKELYLVKGATHIQTYWVPKYVNEIEGKLASFYKANL
ncbi:MAG: alpha/beta hydrolase [Caecibacter sp.]|nr:alpha/beta hydrolase [Caecibacter sp.]